jgi:hypothetical protein
VFWSTVFFIFVPGRIIGYDKVGWLAVGATFIAIAFVGKNHIHTGRPPGDGTNG